MKPDLNFQSLQNSRLFPDFFKKQDAKAMN